MSIAHLLMAFLIILEYECRLTCARQLAEASSMAVGLAMFLPTAPENTWRAPCTVRKQFSITEYDIVAEGSLPEVI